MKKHIVFLFVWISCCISLVNAQEKFKFGDVPKDLLEMTVYDKDSTASAFVVYEKQDVYYKYNLGNLDFELVWDYTIRIKILTADGVDQADGSINYFKGRNSASTEEINGLTGWTYNLDNGKVVKEKLSKEYIFTENINENQKRIKFALPSVKAGSVIEYKYSFTSPFYYWPKTIQFQRSIPVKYSNFKITIPEYFKFNRETKGYESIKTNIKTTSMSFNLKSRILNCSGEEIVAEVIDLPALKDESFVWNYNDFMTRISLELRKIEIRDGEYYYFKDYAQTWDKVVEGLREHEYFGSKLKNRGLFKDELAALPSSGDEEEKIRAILNLVRSKIKWNDRKTSYIIDPSKALKEGVGTSGEINSLLFNALKNAGYETSTVIMSLRSNGRIPMTYPTRDNFNYFIVQVKSGDKTYYLDATRSYCDLNIIPVDCLVDNALCITDKNFNWVNLTQIGNNTLRTSLFVSYNDEGILTGKKTEMRTGECVFSFKQDFERSKDEPEHTRKIETNNDISIFEYLIEEKRASLTESYNFKSNTIRVQGENLFTVPPLLFETMRSNPFKKEERKLPVEFNYPEDNRISIVFSIPEGYVLDEFPKSERFVYGDENEIDFSYIIQANDLNVQIAYRFKLDTCIIPADQYEGLRDFFSKMYAKCQEVLVFKKK